MNEFTSAKDTEVRKWFSRTQVAMAERSGFSRCTKQGQKIFEALQPLSAREWDKTRSTGHELRQIVATLLKAAEPEQSWVSGKLTYPFLGLEAPEKVQVEHEKRLVWLNTLFQTLEEATKNPNWRGWLSPLIESTSPKVWATESSGGGKAGRQITKQRWNWLLNATDGYRNQPFTFELALGVLKLPLEENQKMRFLTEYAESDWRSSRVNFRLAETLLQKADTENGASKIDEHMCLLERLPVSWEKLTVAVVSSPLLNDDVEERVFHAVSAALLQKLPESFLREDKILLAATNARKEVQANAIRFHEFSRPWKERALLRDRLSLALAPGITPLAL